MQAEIDITINRIELGLIKFVDFYLLSLAYMSLSKCCVKKIAKTKFEIRKQTKRGRERKSKSTCEKRVRKVERIDFCNVLSTFSLLHLPSLFYPSLLFSVAFGDGHRAILRQCMTARAKSRGWGRTARVSGYVVTCTYRGGSVFNYGYAMPGGDCRPMCAHMSAPQVALVRRWLAQCMI